MRLFLILLLLFACVPGCGRAKKYYRNYKAQKAKEEKIANIGLAQRREYLEKYLPAETRKKIPENFYTYDGFRDWWRTPLVFPYQLHCIDNLDQASLEMHKLQQSVGDPNKSSASVLWDITRVQTDNKLLALERSIGTSHWPEPGDKKVFELFDYFTGKRSVFTEEDDMWKVAEQAGFTGKQKLLTIKEYYDHYYDFSKKFTTGEKIVLSDEPSEKPAAKQQQPIAKRTVLIQQGKLVMKTGDKQQTLAAANQYLTAEQKDKRLYVYLKLVNDVPLLGILFCDKQGQVFEEWDFCNREFHFARGISKCQWLDANQVFVVMDVNPSAGLGVMLDLSDEQSTVYLGHGFVFDTNGRVAYFHEPPHFGTPQNIPAEIRVNGKKIKAIPRNAGRKLEWLNDATLKVWYKDSIMKSEELHLNVNVKG